MEFNVKLEAKGAKSLFTTQLEELEALAAHENGSDEEITSYIAAESNAECGIYEGDVIHFKRIHSLEEIPDGAIVSDRTDIFTLYRCSAGIVLKAWDTLDNNRALLIKVRDIDDYIGIGGEWITDVAFCIIKHLPDIA